MCSRCGRDAIIPDGYRCGCSGSVNNGNPVQNGPVQAPDAGAAEAHSPGRETGF